MPTPAASTYAASKTVTDALTIEANLLAALAAAGVDLTGYDELSLVKALVSEQATTRNLEQGIRATLAQALDPAILVTLPDDWVDVICLAIYQEPRIAALPTVGTLVVSVASGFGPYTYQAGDLLVQDTSTGAYFTSSNTAPQAATSSSLATFAFTAQTPGAASNPSGSPTWKLISAPSGSSLGLAFGSWARTLAGRDAEGNDAYVARCQAKWGTKGAGGNIDAWDYWIPTGTPAITRWLVDTSNPFGPGSIGVWIADSAGPATTPEVNSAIAYLTPRKALGSGPLVVQAAPAYVDVITATLRSDGTNPNLAADAAAAIAAFGNINLLGPLGITQDIILALLRGAAFDGTITVLTSSGSAVEVPFAWPGFSGCAAVQSVSTSQGGASVDYVPKGYVMQLSASISVVPL